jgi:hypothetical protein
VRSAKGTNFHGKLKVHQVSRAKGSLLRECMGQPPAGLKNVVTVKHFVQLVL